MRWRLRHGCVARARDDIDGANARECDDDGGLTMIAVCVFYARVAGV